MHVFVRNSYRLGQDIAGSARRRKQVTAVGVLLPCVVRWLKVGGDMWRHRLAPVQSGCGPISGDLVSRIQLARVQADSVISKAPRAVGLAAALGALSVSPASCTPSGAQSVPAAGKPYLKKPTLIDSFAPTSLATTLALGVLGPFLAQMNAALRCAADASNAGRVTGQTHDKHGNRLTPFALIKWDRLREDAFFNFVKRMLVNVLHSAAQLGLWHCLDGEQDQRIIAKIIKSVAASAERKSLRFGTASNGNSNNVEAASCIMYTYLRGAVLGWTIYHAVELCWGCTPLPQGHSFRENLRNAVRMPIVLCTGACGAAVGTIIWPGLGTCLGALGGECLPDLFCPVLCGTPMPAVTPRRGKQHRKSRKKRRNGV